MFQNTRYHSLPLMEAVAGLTAIYFIYQSISYPFRHISISLIVSFLYQNGRRHEQTFSKSKVYWGRRKKKK
jgi:hypothetical protein